MIDRIPLTEKKDYELVIKNNDSEITIRELTVIGFGGSCIVYKGKKSLPIGSDNKDCSVVVKEFYPSETDITRLDDMSLRITDERQFAALKVHFSEGQSNHAKFYEYYQDQTLPRMFYYGNANNTVYAVSDPGKGRMLSQINFDTLSLNKIASIMESICAAIRKVHMKEMLYLDCKPDNFFYYAGKNDLQTKVYLFDFDTIISLKDIHSGKNSFCSASSGWVPPEQDLVFISLTGIRKYRNPQWIGYHTDIYSIGAIFFWLLTHRKPTADDINSILNHTLDWEAESIYCNGVESDIIKTIQDIAESTLQPNVDIRSKLFRHYISINAVRDQYRNLYGLTVGDTVHFEPIHSAIKRIEEELFTTTNQIKEDVKKVSEQIAGLQSVIFIRKGAEADIPFRKTTTTNRFQYSVEASAFTGRKAELDYLLDMCNASDNQFSWTGICGSGGVGKSRLAYQLCDVLHEKGWKVYAPSHARVTAQSIEAEMNLLNKDTLICFDDVKPDIDIIIDFIYYCAEAPINIKNKIRLILIERDFKDTFLECSNALIYRYQKKDICYDRLEYNDGFIRLKKPSVEDICSIMKSFALNVYQKNISSDELTALYESLKRVDPQERPLFSLFVCDAWCNGNDVNNWNRDDALEMAANKEYEKAQDLIKSEYSKKSEQNNALNAVKCIITLSGFFKLIKISQLSDFLSSQYKIDFEDDSFQWILKQLGFLEEDRLENTFPDMLSEYISLRFINSLTRNQATSLYNQICKNADQNTFRYGSSICEDYEDLLIAPSNMSIMQFLSEEFQVRVGEQVSAGLSEQEIEEFSRINDVKTARDWLNQYCPNYRDIVIRIMAEITEIFAFSLDNNHKIFMSVNKNLPSGLYVGESVFDWRCGKGRQEYTDNIVYDGEWNKDSQNGIGMMTWPDGTTYDGSWKDGKRNGHGIMEYASGSKFEGEWRDDKRLSGKMFFKNGGQYFGEFKNEEFHGNGVVDFPNGDKFIGECRDGMRYYGKFISVKGWEYVGEWSRDLPNGKGRQIMSDGSSYDGEWKDGKRCGKGVFITSDGDKKTGIWKDGQFVKDLLEQDTY